jgi:hypothetical protein
MAERRTNIDSLPFYRASLPNDVPKSRPGYSRRPETVSAWVGAERSVVAGEHRTQLRKLGPRTLWTLDGTHNGTPLKDDTTSITQRARPVGQTPGA